jgi:hypothetical protein
MATIRRRAAQRSLDVEAQLQARSAQLKPTPEPRLVAEERASRGTPLGCCHHCSAVVYASDDLAMVGGYLVHGSCSA